MNDLWARDKTVILDGSMGQELITSGAVEGTQRWATEGLLTNPQGVIDLHRAYIDAGVDVITTNSYSITQDRFERFGMLDRLRDMLELAASLAHQARDESGIDVAIAACLPPLQGSYRSDLQRSYAIDRPLYQELADVMDEHVDLFLCETMTTLDEARAASDAASGRGKPVWVAWTLQNGGPGRLLSGESWPEAVAAVDADAYLINCSEPEIISVALPQLGAEVGEARFGAYGNGFVSIPVGWSNLDGDALPESRKDLDPEAYTSFVEEWIDVGATIVGGCCEIGPRHMSHLCSHLN